MSMFTVSPVNVAAFVGVIENWPPPLAPMSSHQPGAPPAHQVWPMNTSWFAAK